MKSILFIVLIFFSVVCFSQKPNDYLVAKLENKNLGAYDFQYMELTSFDTQFLSRSEYQKLNYVQKNFKKKDGSFDLETWLRFYDLLAKEWQRFIHWDIVENYTLEKYKIDSALIPVNIKIVECNGCVFWLKL